jgi:hypothetical protein
MGPGFLRVGGGGGIAGNVYINGNVGIGTANPSIGTLDVSGSLRVGSGVGGIINLGRDGSAGAGFRSAYINSTSTNLYILNQQPGAFQFGTNNGEKMRIDINGNVGIGKTNPTAKLDVVGEMGVSGVMTVTQTGLNSYAQLIANSTGQTAGWNSRLMVIPYMGLGGYSNLSSLGDVGIIWGQLGSGTNGNLVIAPHLQMVTGLKIMSDGKVGIGQSAPTATLDVSGTLNATSDISTTSGVYKTAGDLRIFSANGSADTNTIYNAGNQIVFISGNQSLEYARFTNTGLVMNGARNITLGTGTTAPTVGQLGYIYSGTITWATGPGNGLASIDISAGTYIGIFSVTLSGIFVANNYIAVNLGYTARFPIINVASGTDTAMCSGSFFVRALTSSTTITLTNGITNSQSLSSSNFRIVKIA